jgi:4-hydroxybenzoate polyprenyltransferase
MAFTEPAPLHENERRKKPAGLRLFPRPVRPSNRRFNKIVSIGEAVIFRHTLFSLPFALAALLLETAGRPSIWKLAWIVVAVVAGRNAANAINRIIDKDIDAANPRTASRHLPSGRLGSRDLWAFAAAMGALLVLAAAMLEPICVALLPVAAIAIFGYSYTKRFTWLCHYWLGATCAIATMGSLVAVSGRIFELRYFALAGAVALWVAGFDILYALQDIEVDRAQGLHSVPERFGSAWARAIAAASHLGTVALLASAPLFWDLGPAYLVGLGAAAALIAAEHIVALGGTERHIKIAAYGINEVVPLVLLAGVAIDLYLY